MNKNTITFLIGSIGLILGWNWVMQKYYPSAQHPSARASANASKQEASATSGSNNSGAAAPEQVVAFSTTAYEVSLSTWGARFNHLKLRGILSHTKGQLEDMDLVST